MRKRMTTIASVAATTLLLSGNPQDSGKIRGHRFSRLPAGRGLLLDDSNLSDTPTYVQLVDPLAARLQERRISNAHEPTRKLSGLAQVLDSLPCADEGLLGEVVGTRCIAHELPQPIPHARLMPDQQDTECGFISRSDEARDKIRIAWHHRVSAGY